MPCPAHRILCIALLCLLWRPGLGMTLLVAVEDADNRPLEYADATGRPTGFHIELVRRVAASLGWQVSFDRVPWQRAQVLLEAGSVDAVTYLVRSPVRETYAVFLPDNRLSETGLDLWVLKSRLGDIRWQPPLSQMMSRWRLGGIQGWYYNDDYKAAEAKGAPLDLSAPTNIGLARMLLAGRIDIALAEPGFLDQVKAELPEAADRVEILPGSALPGSPVYIGFTRKADGPAKAKDFAAAYAAWRDTPDYGALIEQFGVADRVKFESLPD